MKLSKYFLTAKSTYKSLNNDFKSNMRLNWFANYKPQSIEALDELD